MRRRPLSARLRRGAPETRRLVIWLLPGIAVWSGITLGEFVGLSTGTAGRLLGLAWGWWCATTLVAGQIGLGHLLTRLVRLPAGAASSGGGIVLRLVAGLAGTTTVLTVAAWAGMLRGAGVPVAAVMALLGLRDGLAILGKLRPPAGLTSRLRAASMTGAGLWLLPFFVRSLLPNNDWDGAMQHLPLARRFLEEGLWRVDPVAEQLDYPGGVNLLYALLKGLGAGTGILPLGLLAALLLLLAAWALGKDLGGPRAGLWSVAVLASCQLIWSVAGTPRVDVFLALFTAVAALGILRWLEPTGRPGDALAAAAGMGLALGTKYTALVPLAVLAALAAPAILSRARRGRATTAGALAVLLVLLVPAGTWYLRNGVLLGDPVYPFVRGLAYRDGDERLRPLSEGVRPLSRATPPPEEVARVFGETGIGWLLDAAPPAAAPRSLLDLPGLLLHPERFERKPLHQVSPLLLAFLALPFLGGGRRSRRLFLAGVGIYVLLGARTGIVRYALPALPLLAAGAGVALARLRGARALPAAAIAALLLLTVPVREARSLAAADPGAWLSGEEDELDWVSRAGYNGATNAPRFLLFVDRAVRRGRIGRDDVILLVGEGKTDLLAVRGLPDTGRVGERWLAEVARSGGDDDRLEASLRRRGIGWVGVNYGYLHWVVKTVPARREAIHHTLWRLQRFLGERAERVWEKGGIALWRLRR